MKVKTLKSRLARYIKIHNLVRKYDKQVILLEQNIKHPSLNTEKLMPKEFGLYSFKVDRKYRGIFTITKEGQIEIVDINDHYQ